MLFTRKHFIQCPPGVLNKHYEKLIQCDIRLSTLSQQPEIVIDSPYFESKTPVSENLDESKDDECNQRPASAKGSTSVIEDATPAASVQLSPFDLGQSSMAAQHVSKREAPSPSSGNLIPVSTLNNYSLLLLFLILLNFCT